ncbi:MAG: hypothetical protein AAB354_12660 [candidate division KSB1 bacterium]
MRKKITRFATALFALGAMLVLGCRNDNPTQPDDSKHEQLAQKLQAMLDSMVVKDAAVHNAVLRVEWPG